MDNVHASPIQAAAPQTLAPQTNSPVVAETPDQTPFTLHSGPTPYAAQYFGMSPSQFSALQQADITDLAPKMAAIDDYVKAGIREGKYLDSTQTFTQLMNDIKSMLGITAYDSPSAQIEKIFTYITNGKGMKRSFHVKRSSKADELDHAKNQALKDLRKAYPGKTSRIGMFKTFTQ